MSLAAIDIVLLPNEATNKKILKIHQALNNDNQPIALGSVCLPHLSLAMGGLDAEESANFFELLVEAAKSFQGIKLNFTQISQHQNSKGETIQSLEHESSLNLVQLHQKLIAETKIYLTTKVTAEHFTGKEEINKDSINWVNDYFTHHSSANFEPHITLGVGKSPQNFKPFSSVFTRLAVCHLGNYCTCQKILFETKLGG